MLIRQGGDGDKGETDGQEKQQCSLGAASWLPIMGYLQQLSLSCFADTETHTRWENFVLPTSM